MYDQIIQRLLNGNAVITPEETAYINQQVDRWLMYPIQVYDKPIIYKVIQICNIVYNNIPNMMSPLSDDKYDRLIVICNKNHIDYPIGAPPLQHQLYNSRLLESEIPIQNKEVLQLLDINNMYYFHELSKNKYPIAEEFIRDETVTQEYKRQRSIGHQYNMCGTLDKCKYVLNIDAQRQGVFHDESIAIFERDFLGRHISLGVIDPNNIALLVTFKYDGISVEATIQGDKIVSACSRGDTGNDEATDLTPILYGLTFPRATNVVDINETFGILFEMILTDYNKQLIEDRFNKHYVNSRNAIIGLLGNLDARRYRDYITPIPLRSNIPFPNSMIPTRLQELEFLNRYYTKGVDLRSIVIQGNYAEVLYKLNLAYNEANQIRGTTGFQYDGLVVEYIPDHIRALLGSRPSIPNYSIAIKFPPLVRRSVFTHYTYSIGQTGVITPKAHFYPVEFLGQTHDKTTIHSLKRFNLLKLRKGDLVDLSLNNDVIVYLVKAPESEQDPNNKNPYEIFPTKCPCCGSELVLSTSGDSIYCPNFKCKERNLARMANMLSKLNIKGFSTESFRAVDVFSLKELIEVPLDKLKSILGPIAGTQMRHMIDTQLIGLTQPDYRILGALGFTNLGPETWKRILSNIDLRSLLNAIPENLNGLKLIPGIGEKTIQTIIVEREYLKEDLDIVIKYMHPIPTQLNSVQTKGKVRFTGFRDQQLCDLFIQHGYDCTLDGKFTKDTVILVVPMLGYVSNSVIRAFADLSKKLNQPIRDYNDLMKLREQKISINPVIMSSVEAYNMLENNTNDTSNVI